MRVRITKDGFDIRRWHGRTRWFMKLADGVGVLARAAQVREANNRLGHKGE